MSVKKTGKSKDKVEKKSNRWLALIRNLALVWVWMLLLVVVFLTLLKSDRLHKLKLELNPIWSRQNRVSEITQKIIATNNEEAGKKMWWWWSQSGRVDKEDRLGDYLTPETQVYQRLLMIDEALVIQPSHSNMLIEKVVLLSKLGRFDEAQLTITQLKSSDPNNIYVKLLQDYLASVRRDVEHY